MLEEYVKVHKQVIEWYVKGLFVFTDHHFCRFYDRNDVIALASYTLHLLLPDIHSYIRGARGEASLPGSGVSPANFPLSRVCLRRRQVMSGYQGFAP